MATHNNLPALIASAICVAFGLPAAAEPLAKQAWTLERTRVLVDWPNASLVKAPIVNAQGGEVEVDMRGYGELCPGGTEHVRFRWSFINRDVTVLRPGEDIEARLETKRISSNNICRGELAVRSYLSIGGSGYAATELASWPGTAERQIKEDERFLFKTGRGRAGGDANGDAGSGVLTVNIKQGVDAPVASFVLLPSGPCPESVSCGRVLVIYQYRLGTPQGEDSSGGFTTEDNVSINQAAIIRYFPLQAPAFAPCRDACADDRSCVAYTYVRPGAYKAGDAPMCYLLSTRGQKASSPCCVSGMRSGEGGG